MKATAPTSFSKSEPERRGEQAHQAEQPHREGKHRATQPEEEAGKRERADNGQRYPVAFEQRDVQPLLLRPRCLRGPALGVRSRSRPSRWSRRAGGFRRRCRRARVGGDGQRIAEFVQHPPHVDGRWVRDGQQRVVDVLTDAGDDVLAFVGGQPGQRDSSSNASWAPAPARPTGNPKAMPWVTRNRSIQADVASSSAAERVGKDCHNTST